MGRVDAASDRLWQRRSLLGADRSDGGLGADEADRAIGLADAAFRGRTDWRGAIDGRFDHPGPVELVAAEAQGVADDVLAAALPRLAALRADTGARFVVAIDPGQIDLVAAMLLGERVELLCVPTLADRAAAFAIGLSAFSRDTLHDKNSEGESAQLRQLNDEVARISRALARLANENKRPGGVSERPLAFTPPPVAPVASPATAIDIRKIIRGRRLRDQFFTEGLFEDPAWDMLLDLYAAELEGAQVSVSSLCIAAAVAPTTALRWIGRMTDAGLFVRQPDPFDRRRAFLGLSVEARTKMERYLAALRQSGLDAL
ncbi:MAG: MarR family winged helix-turn-helix transcriptional regulator [Sphingomonas sp.]